MPDRHCRSDDDESDVDEQNHNVDQQKQQDHLNSIFNGHLMKWKYEAEEGSAFLIIVFVL
jgi:hypothetical protein